MKGGVKGGVEGGTIGGTIGGEIGGVKGGTIGGSIGGTAPPAPVAAKFLPPNILESAKISGEQPAFPPSLRRAGVDYVVQAKVCISKEGSVDSVTLVSKSDALLNESVVKMVKTWRFRPQMANNLPIPWCSFSRFVFKGE